MISVIIPHANSRKLLRRLLDSLSLQKGIKDFEVIVVCNPENKYSEYPDWNYIFPLRWAKVKKGANRARKKGIELSRGNILLFLDDDCLVEDPFFLEKHSLYHQSLPEFDGFGGRYLLEGLPTLAACIYHKIQNSWLDKNRLPAGQYVHLLGGNSSYRRRVLQEEQFDEKIVFGGTESELQIRLYHKGHRLKLCEDIPVLHDGHLGFFDFIKKSFKQGMGAAYIDSLHSRPPKFVFYEERKSYNGYFYGLLEWSYKVSFDAGRRYFEESKELVATKNKIYKNFLKAAGRKIFSKEFSLWRELKTLAYVIQAKLLSVTDESRDKEDSRDS